MIAAAILFIVFVSFVTAVHSDDTKVTLKLGTIHGFKEKVDDKVVNVFLGIPYAVPPIGGLRFRKPQPIVEKWSANIDATKWPKLCMQVTHGFTYLSEASEDCLYVNVWTPVNLDEDFTKDLKPVMVYLHGGGFTVFGSAYKHHNGSFLSSFGDVVVVTLNYRLAAFGFLSVDSAEAPGNVGLYDQFLALEWVQENIAYFGGDPKKVTLFGESAGAWSASLHLISPLSRHTFSRAILMSGASYKGVYLDTKDIAAKKVLELSKLLGCNVEGKDDRLTDSHIECLRNADAENLMRAQYAPDIAKMSKMAKLPFLPIVGEAFIPNEPTEMLQSVSNSEKIPVLIGTVADEGSIMHRMLEALGITPKINDYKELLRFFVTQLFNNVPVEETDEMIDFYFNRINSSSNSEEAKFAYYTAVGDAYFNCETVFFADVYSKKNNLYQYFFDYPLKNAEDYTVPCGSNKACHANEIPVTFGTVSDARDIEVSKEWIKLLTHFARTGNLEWPKFEDESRTYYEFSGSETSDRLLHNFRSDACKLWKPIFEKYF